MLVGEEAFDLKAQFDQNKKFKRLVFDINPSLTSSEDPKVTEHAFSALSTACSALNIDQNYFIDFLDSGESQTEFNDNGFKVDILFVRDFGYINVSIESE